MVIEDVSAPLKPSKKESAGRPAVPVLSSKNLAAPIDRLAALMADAVLLVPLISLMTSRFRRHLDLSQLLQDGRGLMSSYIFIVLSAFITVILYQTFFLHRMGATPGKKILGLKVVPLWGGHLTLRQSFLRSFVWIGSFFGFMLPFLGVLSNSKRRPWHDRIADTEVVAVESKFAVGAPDTRELAVANSTLR